MKFRADNTDRAAAFALFGMAMVIVAALFFFFRSAKDSPDIYLLTGEAAASWIKADEPVNLGIWEPGKTAMAFRTKFFVKAAPKTPAVLTVRATRDIAVLFDWRLILPLREDLSKWRESRDVDLSPYLTPGLHELVLAVINSDGPATALAYSDALGLRTGPGWDSSTDYRVWKPAVTVDVVRTPEFTRYFPTVAEAFFARLPYLVVVFAAVVLLTLFGSGRTRFDRFVPSPSALRWALMIALAVLGVNDLVKLPANMGFDADGHIDYIKHLVEKRSLPFANEGLTMFQSPLYYMVTAALYSLLDIFLSYVTVLKAIKIVTVACGAALVEITYRTLNAVYSDRVDLQRLGIVLGGLLPMNIYISQHIGNEPMSGMFTAASIMAAYSLLLSPGKPYRRAALVGGFAGLALLSKVSIALLLPGLSVMVVYAIARREGLRKAAQGFGLFATTAFAVSGWYYIRNWIVLGKPFVGGWENLWSQDPGYRTPGQFLRFGESLYRPFYSGVNSFWDSLYSSMWSDGFLSSVIYFDKVPAWNYDLLLATTLLSVVPMLVIIAGGIISACSLKDMARGERFSAFFVFSFLAGMIYLYLKVPIYSQAKATYMMGLTPCFALLFVRGARPLVRWAVTRAVLYGWMACWAAATYLSFFIVR